MKNFTQFFKTTFILATILLLGGGNVWGYYDGEDITSKQTSWTKSKADFQTGRERYETYNYTAEEGKIMYMSISGLESVGYYEVQFYAAANSTSGRGFTNIYGDNIAQWYVNDQSFDLSVINQTGCTLENEAYLRTAVVYVNDGNLEFGLKNIATGGNWYVAKVKSIKYVGVLPTSRWSWTGETRSAGQFYFLNKQHSQFMSVNEQGSPYLVDLENALTFTIGASGKTDLAYNVGGNTYYVYQDAGSYGKWVNEQDAPSSQRCSDSFVSMSYGGWDLADWNNSDNNFRFSSSHKYTYSAGWMGMGKANKHESDDKRYIYVAEASGTANCTKNSSEYNTDKARWFLISADQKNVYDKRTISFSATANYGEGGTASASVADAYVELLNYADRNNTHSTTATFTATPNDGKVFVGWSTDAEGRNIINHDKEYQATITNNWNEGQTSSLTLYAIFGDKFEPSITAEKYDLKVEEQTALTFTHTENLAAPVIGNTSVISYSDGVVTALAEGTSTLTFTQEETSTIKAKVIVLTFNVTKHDVVWSWNAENVAYLYNTTINNILTLTEGNPSNISIVSDNELVAKVENGNLVIGKVAGTAQFTVTAVADNKWNAKEETFTVTPGHVANHVPLNYDQALYENINVTTKDANLNAVDNYTNFKVSGTKSQEHYLQIALEGIPNELSFHYKPVNNTGIGNWEGNYYYVRESADGVTWSDNIWNAEGGSNNTYVDANVTLKRTTRFVRFIYKGHENGGYFGDIKITELKALFAETPEAIETTLGDTESVSTNIVLTYANAGFTINASVTGEGFSINKTSVEGGIDVYGEETFVVSFDPTGKAAGEHSATVTFTDGTLQKEVVVTAHVLVPLSLVAMNNENGTDYYYATFSNADYAVEFGEDVEVYTVSVDGDRMTLYPVSNNQVPANNGVLIKSKSNNILYKYISSAANLSDNMLQPGTGGMTEGDNCRFYRLAYYDYAAKTGLGFYYGSGCEDGQAFKCKAGTAYLAVPRTVAAPARFLLGRQDVSTEIENMIIDNTSTSSSLADGKKVMVNGVLYILRDGKTYDSFGRMVK